MLTTPPAHRCHACGATSYRPVLARDTRGALRPCGRYRCSGCAVVFSDTHDWWNGTAEAPDDTADFQATMPLAMP